MHELQMYLVNPVRGRPKKTVADILVATSNF